MRDICKGFFGERAASALRLYCEPFVRIVGSASAIFPQVSAFVSYKDSIYP